MFSPFYIFRCQHVAPTPFRAMVRMKVSILRKPTTKRYLAYSAPSSDAISSSSLQNIQAPDISLAEHIDHVQIISKHLAKSGMLKITLGFADEESNYLTRLILGLHKYSGHKLPISHSATRGWYWDVRPSKDKFQAGNHQARSETMREFPWHTDCSYENPPPRYFALQVLQHDRFGGGTLSIMNVQKLCGLLSSETLSALAAPEYRMTIPPEFIKDSSQAYITGSILGLTPSNQLPIMRFREDILTPLTDRAARALEELKGVFRNEEIQAQAILHLQAADLPKGSIVLIDNRRWLHARNDIKDPGRHLRRVRWDACSFDGICDEVRH
ncbi:hypothetical protein HG530_010494 [Fusarium avenaceum]|nr:hypothetical protein HG530_010494 [Fusarium avenaceum]